MITIGQTPKILEPFLDALRSLFSKPQFRHFGPMLLAYAIAFGRRHVQSLHAVMPETTCRQKLNDVLVESPWPADAVLRDAALFALRLMIPRKGERLEILIDGSAKRKRGKATDAVGYIKEAGSSVFVPGHKYLKVALRFRGVILPWAVDLYIPKKFFRTPRGKDLAQRTGRRFRTLNEMTAQLLALMPKDWARFFKVYVLMDSGFCNPTACSAVRDQGFHFICAAQSSRHFWADRGRKKSKKVKLNTYVPGFLRYRGRDVELEPKRRSGTKRKFRWATQTGSMNGIGRVRGVFSKRKSDGNVLTLVTSDLDLSAEEVATGYGWRWEMEVTIKALQQHLGLGDYPHRWFEGAWHHLHLSCLAHLALTVAELHRLGQRAQRSDAVLQLPSVHRLQNRLRAEVWKDLLQKLRRPSCRDEILHQLARSLRLEETVFHDAA